METIKLILLRVIGLTSGVGFLVTLLFLFLIRYSDSGPNAGNLRAMSIIAAFFFISAVISRLLFRQTSSLNNKE